MARLHRLVRKQEQAARFARPAGPDQHQLARQVERLVARLAADWGYRSWFTPHKSPFDIWIENVRVEVKASNWQQAGRYQARIRNHQADLIIFDAINGSDHFFIIPMAMVIPRQTVEVTRYDVSEYSGRWAVFLEAWNVLHQAIENAPSRPVQLALWELAHVDLPTNS